jgi:nitronate monooxygenase
VLRNEFTEKWRGKEDVLARDPGAVARFREAVERGDLSAVPVWASEAIDLITDVAQAAVLVEQLAAEAEAALARALR